MSTSYNFYKVEKKDNVAWVFLNRPEKKNAMGPDAWREIVPIFADIEADDEIRVAVIAGEGKDFSAGIDLVGMAPLIPTLKNWDMSAKATVKLFKDIFPLQDSMTCVEKCSKPVICAFHGYCIGAALDLGAACDIRLASEDARISLREAAVAIIADVGVLQRLPHIVGQGVTREMAFTAKFITARRALQVNLVNEVYPDKEALLKGAADLAAEIAAQAPLAVQGAKEVLNYCRGKSIADGLEYVAARSAMILPSEDLAETMAAFMEKRTPKYKGK
ncbi:MAG: crotonase/enoyl-CoA hydratase family protein [Desulfomonilia bacterium]|jgi:enoyl-CoA hydratase|uniref:Enoyl-CoA hydratase/isomerase n=1 Tax=anaerobic digester metagenome TaxID=1263854 RepID=A0A485LU88_9ZZZZ|nr:crotonase/enoyl-CoA hydratase family protein [Pseudomonadota bacterium]HON37832.1 crotonase/enoyl-CoA hydratase family protein [Deltaproteobacteria bacterium]HRS55880.1 crotonase/enoyl-CoA hydratase family protein [Desulfomonilia bacterium]HPD21091.1 crotonase/enoyl-CoA hydratase family protein [Deltaproteobacteria bacterium]HPX17997.1 crotonase/enoyl-CoA hydratase family protein [Deltaproteobacteria bacterium]